MNGPLEVPALAVGDAPSPKAPTSREEAARQFESLFLSLLVKEMRQSLQEGGLFGEGAGAAVYEGFFDQMMAESLAQGQGTGLREAILSTWPKESVQPNADGTTGSSSESLPTSVRASESTGTHGVSMETTP